MFEKITVKLDEKEVPVLIDTLFESATSERPICFVLGLSSHYHDKFSKDFRKFYQLVLVDLYWTDSTFPCEYIKKITIPSLANHIEIVRSQLETHLGKQYKKIFIASHSAYGFIGVQYALDYPDKLHGALNIASPLVFQGKILEQWQEEYLYSNYGHHKVNGPTERFTSYHTQKEAFKTCEPSKSKPYFVDWYRSMGPLLWKKPDFWSRKSLLAEEIWEPWAITTTDKKTGVIESQLKDINMEMMFHYMSLITDYQCYDIVSKIDIPLLWVIPLHDCRVSLYQLEDKRLDNLPQHIEFFHPSESSHWPMYPDDCDTTEFDQKTIEWGCIAIKNEDANGSSLNC